MIKAPIILHNHSCFKLTSPRLLKDGKNIYKQRYERGNPVTELEVTGKSKGTGTYVHFKPDSTIFDDLIYDLYQYSIFGKDKTYSSKLREMLGGENDG